MKGTNYTLAITTATDEVTGDVKPLFAFPVQICKGTDSDDVRFDIAAPSGAKREQIYRDSATGEIIEDSECLRGVRLGDDFKQIPQEAIDSINAESKITTIVAAERVALAGLREQYGDRITGRYFVQSPAKAGSPKAYRLTYEVLAADGDALVVKRTKSTKQALGWIYADTNEGCLMFVECAFASQVRHADEQVKQPLTAEVSQAMIDKARAVFATLPTDVGVLDNAIDDAQALKRDLIEQAVAGEAINVPTPVSATIESDNLEALLEASLAGSGQITI